MPTNDIPHKPAFSVHVDDDITNLPPPTPQHVSQFDKVLSSRKPDKPSVMDALRNKVNLLYMYIHITFFGSRKTKKCGTSITCIANEQWDVSN